MSKKVSKMSLFVAPLNQLVFQKKLATCVFLSFSFDEKMNPRRNKEKNSSGLRNVRLFKNSASQKIWMTPFQSFRHKKITQLFFALLLMAPAMLQTTVDDPVSLARLPNFQADQKYEEISSE